MRPRLEQPVSRRLRRVFARACYEQQFYGRVRISYARVEATVTPRQARLLAAKLIVEADKAERLGKKSDAIQTVAEAAKVLGKRLVEELR